MRTSRIGPPIPARCTGAVIQCGLPPTSTSTRLVRLPFENSTVSSSTNVSARASLSKNPSHGKKFGWWIATTCGRTIRITRSERPSISTVSRRPGDLAEPGLAVHGARGRVRLEHVQRHPPQPELAERMPKQQLDRLAPVAAALLRRARRSGSEAPRSRCRSSAAGTTRSTRPSPSTGCRRSARRSRWRIAANQASWSARATGRNGALETTSSRSLIHAKSRSESSSRSGGQPDALSHSGARGRSCPCAAPLPAPSGT